jgi:hypothetical protein
MVARTHLLRQQGRPVAAISRLICGTRKNRESSTRAEDAIDALACGLDIVYRLQSASLFRTRAARRAIEMPLDFMYARASRFRDSLPIDLLGKLQTQRLRHMALFADDNEKRPLLGKLWRLVHEQYSAPDWYVESGPLVPGYFLIEQSTAREQDRLADLVRIKLELADVLLSALRRRWPGGISDVGKEFKRKGEYQARAEFELGKICTQVLFQLLFDSSRIATALREHGLQVSIAAYWQKTDRLLGGVSYWKQQRLYLPSRPRHLDTAEPRSESSATGAVRTFDEHRDPLPPD